MRLSGHTTPARAPVTITFNGRAIAALEGESVAAALAAQEIVALRRPCDEAPAERGLWCGMGACFECIVTINGRLGERACLARVKAGMVIESQPLATLADLSALATPVVSNGPDQRCCDVLVIGAGPAGLSAAIAAAESGLRVTLIDERHETGGQFFKPLAPSQRFVDPDRADDQYRTGESLAQSARRLGITIETGATVWGTFGALDVAAMVGDRAVTYRPARLVLATGAYERAVPIAGWTLPGVMTTGAVQTLVRSYRVSPGKKVLIAGNGPLNFQLACELVESGVKVVAVLESAAPPWRSNWLRTFDMAVNAPDLLQYGMRYLVKLWRTGVPIRWGTTVSAAIGRDRFERAVVSPVGRDERASQVVRETIEADVLALGLGFVPSVEIARMLGCRMRFDNRHVGALAVDIDTEGRTSVEGVYAIGDGASIGGARVAEVRGRIAGLSIAQSLGHAVAHDAMRNARSVLGRAQRFQQALWSVFQAPPFAASEITDDTIVCRCESVPAHAIRTVIQAGFPHIGAIKRHTRCGMGRCQGRYCAAVVARMIEHATGVAPDAHAMFAPRVPAKPVPIGTLTFEKPEWGGHVRVTPPPPVLHNPAGIDPLGGHESQCDVAVIGGGVVGSCCAFFLAQLGVDVIVIERDELNMQASGGNAGSLHVQLLSFDFGVKAEAGGAPAAATLPLGPASVTLWRELEHLAGESFEIQTVGGLMVADNPEQMRFLQAKIDLERTFGIEAHLLGPRELAGLAPALSRDLAGAELCPAEGKINPLRATYAVARLASARGARFVRSADVTAIERQDGNGFALHTTGFALHTTRGRIRSRRIVNAAGPWSPRIAAMVGIDRLPVQGAPLQMIVTESAPQSLTHLVAHADRHLSLKQADTGGFIIGGGWTAGADQSTGYSSILQESLEGNLWVAQRVVPALDRLRVIRAWAAMNVHIDGAPIIGESAHVPGFYNCVASNGYTLAPIVGRLTAELMIKGRPSLAVDAYTLDRFR